MTKQTPVRSRRKVAAKKNASRTIDLSSRAMLVCLNLYGWSGRKHDRKITEEVNTAHGAEADAGRYHKRLVAKGALDEINRIEGAARTDHYRLTLPWMNEGTRIMPADAFHAYSDTMRKHREAHEAAIAEFVANYPAMIEAAKVQLNGMFDPADYPDPALIRERFRWELKILPMPASDDFRVNLADEVMDAVKAEIEANVTNAMTAAMKEVWARLHTVVAKMAERLAAYQPATAESKATGTFRDSLVENIRELLDVLPMLNVTDDQHLKDTIEDVRAKLTKHDASKLRDDPEARAETRQAAEELAADMAAFMGN